MPVAGIAREALMNIAVMSDSHDNIWNLRKALEVISSRHCERIIHCGDFVAPFVFKEFIQAQIPVYAVFGNNDGDRYLLTRTAADSSGLITLFSLVGECTVDGRRVAFTHEWPVAEGLAATGAYDLVCFGHSHQYDQDRTGSTIVLNPGEVMGKDGDPGFCIVDMDSLGIERIDIH
jgi:uncharacterized protein